MIPVRCNHCGKNLKIKDELAGKKIKCPGCQKAVAVPQPAASLSPPPSSASFSPKTEEMEEKSREEGKTLPPKARGPGDEATLPPRKRSPSAKDSHGQATPGHGTRLVARWPVSGVAQGRL